jgi:hypothetical protein
MSGRNLAIAATGVVVITIGLPIAIAAANGFPVGRMALIATVFLFSVVGAFLLRRIGRRPEDHTR